MAVRPIRLFPDRVLSEPGRTIRDFGKPLADLIQDLQDTLKHSPGVGIAATQIGISQRVAIVQVGKSRKVPEGSTNQGLIILVNPLLMSGTGTQVPREGCLSVPDLLANVRRHRDVVVRTQTPEGGERIVRASGFEALALQHEIDHLDGKLFLDRVANLKTDLFRRTTY